MGKSDSILVMFVYLSFIAFLVFLMVPVEDEAEMLKRQNDSLRVENQLLADSLFTIEVKLSVYKALYE